ncbi:YitT family protein [Paenibacillus flagellatus]|uniref:DUF2179 domain-containing protein n=1 Tax=Paenibacillus flagellatus TaxID=2211139 RepID=A0A2V5KC24_9BACL|nr:YitT family protein [Paenibacillus flagellatus]PYI57135.1 hypothetical protein DLM86_01435 [Paenibacillus flagellatus]
MRMQKLRNELYSYMIVTAGCLLIAIGFNLLQRPNRIAAGGVPGLSTIVEACTGISPALFQWGINGALLVAGGWMLGRSFVLKTAYGSALLPLLAYATADWPALTANPLLAALYGGVVTGAGLGLLFRVDGTIGGFSVIAALLQRRRGIAPGKTIAAFDFAVVALSGIVFSPESALYALVGWFAMKKTIPLVQSAGAKSTFAIVISDRADAVKASVLERLDRGLTELHGNGGFSGAEKRVQMVVLRQSEVPRLKRLVAEADPEAFVLIGDAHDVMGDGFDRFRAVRANGRTRKTMFRTVRDSARVPGR